MSDLRTRALLIATDPSKVRLHEGEPLFQCVFCHNGKRIFYEPVMTRREDGGYILSGEFAFHSFDTHGIDHDSLAEMLRKTFAKKLQEARHA